jgi:hypothetical protein
VPSGDYQDPAETAAWNNITAPTMIMGGYIMRANRLGFTVSNTIPDTAGTVRLSVNAPTHPIFAGVALDAGNVMVNPFAALATFTNTTQRGISVNTDAAAGGGQVLATVGTAGDPAAGGMVIGEWPAGAVMLNRGDTLGGPRLVFLSGSREASGLTSEGAGIYDLGADGATLFLNAVAYMTTPRPQGPDLTIQLTGANVSVSWQSETSAVVQSSPTLGPANWTDMNPQPPITDVGGVKTATIPIGSGNLFIRLSQAEP